MLHDHARGLGELGHEAARGIEVEQVVEGERPAVLLRDPGEHVRPGAGLDVQRALLVRVFAVGEVHELLVWHDPVVRERLVAHPEPAGDRRVVGGRMRERLRGEPVARLRRDLAPELVQLLEHRVVGLGAHDHRDAVVVLGRRADHRGTADVDVLDRLVLAHVELRDRALERVEVDADQVDRLDRLRLEGRHVIGVVAAGEQRGVEPRVQGLHPPVQDLRRAGELGHVGDLDPGLAQRRRRPARGEDLHPQRAQPPGELGDPGLVRDRDQRPANAYGRSTGRGAPFRGDRRLDAHHERV